MNQTQGPKPIHLLLAVIMFALAQVSCSFFPELIQAPADIRITAWDMAQAYIGMPYEYGGQDFAPRGIDCSGLIVNTYDEALRDTRYFLPFEDAAVIDFLNKYTVPRTNPEKGDLIFIGDGAITHIALFEKIENSRVYFVDAYTGYDQVTYRSYPIDSLYIHSYGRLLIYSY